MGKPQCEIYLLNFLKLSNSFAGADERRQIVAAIEDYKTYTCLKFPEKGSRTRNYVNIVPGSGWVLLEGFLKFSLFINHSVHYFYYHPHPKDLGRYCFQFVSPHVDGGYPHPSWWRGYTHPSQWGGTTILPDGRGVPPSQIRMAGGSSIPGQDQGERYPPKWNSIACTCYTAGSMPLVFTQKDLLVKTVFSATSQKYITTLVTTVSDIISNLVLKKVKHS